MVLDEAIEQLKAGNKVVLPGAGGLVFLRDGATPAIERLDKNDLWQVSLTRRQRFSDKFELKKS